MAAGSERLFVVFQDEGLGLGLGAGVSVKRAGRRRDGLVGAVMVATRVDAQRADVHESLDLSVAGRVEEEPEGSDVEAAEFCERAPVAHLGRTVEDPVGPGDSPSQRFGVLQVSRDLLDPQLVEPAGVAAGADSALTRCPRRSASSAAWPPTSPVAPVMKMVLGWAVSMRLSSRAILGDPHRGDTAVLAARVTTSHFTWSAAAGGGGCEKVVSRTV